VYKFLPNTAVPYRTALVGAVAALPLWMVARWGFGLYIGHAAKANVYGALGLLPVFLFWMNLSWFIFLFGAEFAYTAANLDRLEGTRHYDETIRQNVRRVIDRAQTALKDLSLADLVKNGGREQK